MKTVYFLGAGASKGSDFQLPTMEGFFREEDFEGGRFPALNKFRSEMFPKIPIHQLNMEEVIAHLELSLGGFGAQWANPNPDLLSSRMEFNQYVRERLRHFSGPQFGGRPPQGAVCKVHQALVESFATVNDEVSILTLNYDLLIDHVLYFLKGIPLVKNILSSTYTIMSPNLYAGHTPPSLTPKDIEQLYVLKLHGSIHWVYCPFAECDHHRYFFENSIEEMTEVYPPGSPCSLCGTGLVSVIIPPTLSKSFHQFPKMRLIWNLAYRKLCTADRWVLIGMSLPPSDYHLTWLLREAASKREGRSRPQVEVANPDAEPGSGLLRRISEIVGVDEKDIVWHKGLKEYVDQLPAEGKWGLEAKG